MTDNHCTGITIHLRRKRLGWIPAAAPSDCAAAATAAAISAAAHVTFVYHYYGTIFGCTFLCMRVVPPFSGCSPYLFRRVLVSSSSIKHTHVLFFCHHR